MKLKNFTLLAFVGVVILALQSLFYVFTNAGVITFNSDPKMMFTEKEFSVIGLLTSILVGISSVTTWAILNVLSNISINMYKIKDSLKAK
jgi:uncharacterized membrane protein (Fun14 family)